MGSIRMGSEVPGPASAVLGATARASVGRPVSPGDAEVFIARASGAVLEDVDGNCFLDFTGGLGCLTVGHSHPAVVAAVREVAGRFLHTDYSVVAYPEYAALAAGIAPRCGAGRKVAFFNSGAEAVENAVKIARAVTGRPGIVCFAGAFHGRTNLAMALTDREVPYKAGFGPFTPEIYRLPYPNFAGATLAGCLAAAEEVLSQHSIAAAIVEPELGEGGYVVPPTGFLPALADLFHHHGALLIADEIQSGYGRAGAFLASDLSGVHPDLITLGKSIASGLPLSAVVGDVAVMDALDSGRLGGTYPGNPVALAAGLAVLSVIDQEGLIRRAGVIGDRLRAGWGEIAAAAPGQITEIRGLGCMLGVEFVSREALAALRLEAARRGVLTVTAGAEGRVLRHLMPLVITDPQLDEALAVFAESSRLAVASAG